MDKRRRFDPGARDFARAAERECNVMDNAFCIGFALLLLATAALGASWFAGV